GITGFLIEHQGTFLQVLEGEGETVSDLFARICRDTRHRNLAVLGRWERTERSFGFWAMNFGPLDNPDFWDGDFSPLRQGEAFRRKSCDPETALAVLCRAYAFASKVAGCDPVIGDFVMGFSPPARRPVSV
ncbi:MAG: BLUF domain-containing protein, partial [Alphaproteobacteria bacterium]